MNRVAMFLFAALGDGALLLGLLLIGRGVFGGAGPQIGMVIGGVCLGAFAVAVDRFVTKRGLYFRKRND